MPIPRIDSFSPSNGTTGTVVHLAGQYFTGATAVDVGSKAATFTVASDAGIDVTVPVLNPGAYSITVTTPGGAGVSATAFRVPMARVAAVRLYRVAGGVQ